MDVDGDHIVNALYIDAVRCAVLKHIKGWSYRKTSLRTASQPPVSALHALL
jgi:hypothetical protein